MKKIKSKKNWAVEIKKGNTDKFYKSAAWKRLRYSVLDYYHYECQRCLCLWNDNKHVNTTKKLTEATMVHHIVPIKENPNLCLVFSNCIPLCFKCHEIIEDRNRQYFKKQNKFINEEWY